MTWILTNSGREHSFCGPHIEQDIPSLHEIAHSLAHINRFTGHARRAYSVAEHSLLVADMVRDAGLGARAELCALMHDAHESIVGDMATPVKQVLGAVWADFEDAQQERLLEAYDLVIDMECYAPMIKHYDLKALATERRDLLPWGANTHTPWPSIDTPGEAIRPLLEVNLADYERERVNPHSWAICWLLRTQKLLETTK